MTFKTESNIDKERRNKARIDPLKAAHHDAVYTLARASEAHDEDTGAHVLRIRSIVERLALQLGFSQQDAEDLGYDAMLHDVGKLRIPPEILKKPGQLTEQERQMMESHTVRGERLLSERPSMRRASIIAKHHHENWDGSGYPSGLRGEQIPLEARITAAADILDALIAQRSYKPSWKYEDAFHEVMNLSGAKLDPQVVEALKRCNDADELREVFEV